LPIVYWALGRTGDSDQSLKAFIDAYASTGALPIAKIFAVRGDRDSAFKWLDIAYEHHESALGLIK
jgi:hypothetical protein